MGEAKRRGSAEQRRAEGERLRKISEATRQLRREQRWAAMTPQEREMAVLLLAFGAIAP